MKMWNSRGLRIYLCLGDFRVNSIFVSCPWASASGFCFFDFWFFGLQIQLRAHTTTYLDDHVGEYRAGPYIAAQKQVFGTHLVEADEAFSLAVKEREGSLAAACGLHW